MNPEIKIGSIYRIECSTCPNGGEDCEWTGKYVRARSIESSRYRYEMITVALLSEPDNLASFPRKDLIPITEQDG